MNKKKFIIFFVAIILLYGIIVFAIGRNNNNNGNTNTDNPNGSNQKPIKQIDYDYLVIGNISLWGLNKGHWYDLDKNDLDSDEYLNVYINNNYFGKYKMKFVNSWNLFNSNNDYVSYEGNIVAASDNINLINRTYSIQTLSELEINEINEIMGVSVALEDLSNAEKIFIDLDQNGVYDKIVNVSNLDAFDIQEKYFNLCYVIMNSEKKTLIKNEIDEEDILSEPIYNIVNIININNELNDSIVFQEGYFSENGETTNLLYQYKNSNYKEVLN